jgi:hypothetical protein
MCVCFCASETKTAAMHFSVKVLSMIIDAADQAAYAMPYFYMRTKVCACLQLCGVCVLCVCVCVCVRVCVCVCVCV